MSKLMANVMRPPGWLTALPVLVSLAALGVYASMMGGGVTVDNLPLAARLAGWNDQPVAGQPLLWLLTLPLEVLPAAWVPVAIKLFSATLAAAILGLLVRTVQLLPWDSSWGNASRLAAALPVILACVLCGLEFSFWQQATTTCGELLDLLLLVAAVWLLLEYRAAGRSHRRRKHGAGGQSHGLGEHRPAGRSHGPGGHRASRRSRWLNAAVLVWGLGMAENWAMLLALPLFVAGVIRLLGFRIFRWRVVRRLLLLGLAGFSLYLLLPLVNGLSPRSPWSFFQAWQETLHQTRQIIAGVYYQFWRGHRLLLLAVVVNYAVPMLPLLVRLRDEGMQNKSRMDRFQLWLSRRLRWCLLLGCCWLAFDPGVAWGVWRPMLSFDYLNALGAAYLLGNLLLVSQPVFVHGKLRRSHHWFPWRRLVPAAAAAGVLVVAAGLVFRNAPAIWHLNSNPLTEFGEAALTSLPPGRGIMLSDNPEKLAVFQAALARRHRAADWLAVDVRSLPLPAYRARLNRRQPGVWLDGASAHELKPVETLRLLKDVARSHRLFYLHPGLGYVFEQFYLEPAGSVYELKPRGADPLAVPPLPAASLAAGEQFWTSLWGQRLARLAPPSHRLLGWEKKLAHYGLVPAPRFQEQVLADWFSVALDGWAVALQKQGRWPAAQARLEEARQLMTNNLSASLNLNCNTNFQSGVPLQLADVLQVAENLGGMNRLHLLLASCGPLDEPAMDYLVGNLLLKEGCPWQAAEQMERVKTLVPGALDPELILADVFNQLQMPGRSGPIISHLRAEAAKLPPNNTLDLNLALLEVGMSILETNRAGARETLSALLAQHPDDPAIASRAASAYLALGDLTNALRVADAQLARTPDDVLCLHKKAVILMQCGRSGEAIPLLNRILTITNLPPARVSRAFAYLALENFGQAENDFRAMEKEGNPLPAVSLGLAAVAEHNHDTNQAVHYLRLCLTDSPNHSSLWKQANAHLQSLVPGTPVP